MLRAVPDQTRMLTDALQVLAQGVRSVPGCLSVEIYKTVATPHCLCYDEIWESEASLRRMIKSRHFSQLASLMELSSHPPVCEFRFISKTQGIDFADQVRRGC
ncbi:antibiotic biosynthesis monooxygenase [Methylomonas sp. LL1]|uniref:antibiotic biosynthesis monooxygenase family protein n=1 Tax=Methylomonas sp. LL1 TaxID=2785785 RepID=UPI0018C40AE0|nr:antibiotic biosynthesis monooxygenase family protein [Methylomonas sp. LL1]QPK63561.1 antibiotic biosynthesis monooxygenase [Methylomonas sp. LL1]